MFDWDDGGADQFQFQNDPFGDGPNRTDPSAPNYDPWVSGTLPNGAPMFVQLGLGDVLGGIIGGTGDALEGVGDGLAGLMGTDLGDLLGWSLDNGFLEGVMVSDGTSFDAVIKSPLNGTSVTVSSSSGHLSVYIR